jgi:ankyrin repeat protein
MLRARSYLLFLLALQVCAGVYSMEPDASCSSLHEAAQENNCSRIQALIDTQADINACGPEGRTPLLTAIIGDARDAAMLLIDLGADVTLADANGSTALHEAAWKGWDEIVTELLKRRAPVNARDSHQRTPLHYLFDLTINRLCSLSCDTRPWPDVERIARVLIVNGADIHARDDRGFTVFDLAMFRRVERVISLLTELGAQQTEEEDNIARMRRAHLEIDLELIAEQNPHSAPPSPSRSNKAPLKALLVKAKSAFW